VIDDDEEEKEEEEGRIMARFNYSECLETGVTAMAPVFLLQMPLSVRTKEKETNSQLNLISRRLSSPISLAPMNGPRIALLSLCLSLSVCVCVCVGMALLQLSDIQQGSLTNRLDVVLKKNLAFWLAMLFSSSLGFVIIFPAAAMSDCLGQNRVHWQMQSRQFSYSFIHSCFVQVLFPLTCCVCQKNYISLQLLRKWEFSVYLLHNHNNDDLINRMQDALDHCTLLICMSLSTSSDRNAEK
jgi:magnesium-transporting ATPase (P-type)